MMNKHICIILLCFATLNGYSQSCNQHTDFSFGVIADCQCGSADCSSANKLQTAVDYFNLTDIQFLAHLGDFIQSSYDNYSVVKPIMDELNVPVKFALGNHEFDVPDSLKSSLTTLLEMPDYYYDFVIQDWRFIVIETTETGSYAQAVHPNVTVCGVAGITLTQLNWIEQKIIEAQQRKQKVVLFGHHPVDGFCNSDLFQQVLENYPNVVAYMNGHKHTGDYFQRNGIHYLTFKAMLVNTTSTYSQILVRENELEVRGFGNQPDQILSFDPIDYSYLIGSSCEDSISCTIGSVYDTNCNCIGGVDTCVVTTKVFLEGFYNSNTQEMHTLLKDKNLLPLQQPYNIAPWNYAGIERVTTIPDRAVDWILIMVRDTNANVIEQRAGFISQAGNIMNIDGTQGISLPNGLGNQISIHHRSHLAIVSASPYTGGVYDFTTASTQAQGTEQLKLASGKYLLYAGDYDSSGIINSADFNSWKIQAAKLNEYLPIDGDGNGIINAVDFNLWINNRSKIGEQIIRY